MAASPCNAQLLLELHVYPQFPMSSSFPGLAAIFDLHLFWQREWLNQRQCRSSPTCLKRQVNATLILAATVQQFLCRLFAQGLQVLHLEFHHRFQSIGQVKRPNFWNICLNHRANSKSGPIPHVPILVG